MTLKKFFADARKAIAAHAKSLDWNAIHQTAAIPEEHRETLQRVASDALKESLTAYHGHLTEAADVHEKSRKNGIREKAEALRTNFLEKFGQARDKLQTQVEALRQTAVEIELQRAAELERARENANRDVQNHANEKYKDFIREKYGLGSLLDSRRFHEELASLVGEDAAKTHWNPDAERGSWADQLSRTIENLKGHRRLSHAFRVSGQGTEAETAQRRIDLFVLRHTLASLHGYHETNELLASEGLDHGHLLKQIEAMTPEQLKQMTPERITALVNEARRAAEKPVPETPAEPKKQVPTRPEPQGRPLFEKSTARPVTGAVRPTRRLNIFQKIGAGLAGLGVAAGLGYGAYKLGDSIPISMPTPARPTASTRIVSPAAPTPGIPHPSGEKPEGRMSGSDFLTFVQGLKIVPHQYHPNFSVVHHDALLAALLEGRAVDQGWAVDTGNGTKMVENRATRRAMEKEARRLKVKLDVTLKKMGPSAFHPVKGTGKPGPQYNTVESTLHLIREMKIGGPVAHRVTTRALGIHARR